MLLLTQPSEMQGGGLTGAFSEGAQHPGVGQGVQFSSQNGTVGPGQAPLSPLHPPPSGWSGTEAFTWGQPSATDTFYEKSFC